MSACVCVSPFLSSCSCVGLEMGRWGRGWVGFVDFLGGLCDGGGWI